jgi:hypothetical protein
MALVKCKECGTTHYFTVEMMVKLVEQFQNGNGHIVSRDYPYRWENLNGSGMVTQVKSKCLCRIDGIKPTQPQKRGRPRNGS